MKLLREDFGTFFTEMHPGHQPFTWQERLLDSVLAEGRWPSRIVAPTGAGKTVVIDVHVFAQALMATGDEPSVPRRLAMVVDRRVLVDDQHRYALELARRLASPNRDDFPVLAAMSELLWTLRVPDTDRRAEESARPGVSPLIVGRLRGGAPPSRTWRDHPTAAAVICATPDMWGSRLLFRGYGSSSLAWPREAGLLAVDSVAVVDEAHLARQMLCTARRVAELAPIAERAIAVAPLQVVETTATPADEAKTSSIGVEEADLTDELLSHRLRRPKPVTLLPVKDWDSVKPQAKAPTALADAVIELLRDALPKGEDVTHTVGCFVNTVGRAVAVTQELRQRDLRVVMICGQARPIDIDRLEHRYPGLLSPAGNSGVDVLVSTQSLEVGVDLDLAGLVTELASGSALAQRAGRVNRRGLRPHGRIVVTVPDGAMTDRARSGPYGVAELRDAKEWLDVRAADPDGLAPWPLRGDPPPAATPRRMLFQRPELAQAWHWARTSDDLAAEPELDLWLSEDFADDTSVGLVVRDALPEDSADATQLIRALPPRHHEVFPVPFRSARDALAALHAVAPLAAFLVRGEDVGLLEWRPSDYRRPVEQPKIRPGDIVVIDSSAELFTGSASFSPPVLVPADSENVPRHRADDVLEAQAELPEEVWADRRVGGVVHRIELTSEPTDPELAVLRKALDSEGQPADPEDDREVVRTWLDQRESLSPMAAAARELLSEKGTRAEVVVQRIAKDQPTRVLVIDRRRAVADEAIRQVWTPIGHEVTLDAHQEAVAARAAELGRSLGLDGELVEMLSLAGAHHDDGKRDDRFQRRLGAGDGVVLAKSRAGTTAERASRNENRSGLPRRWRHEQLSVLDAWDAIANVSDPQLVARLVGTSHGHGRSGFPHAARELLPDADTTTKKLFDLGGWDDIIEQTQQRYGVWGCAFLEAVLRAADGQVSGEDR
jgi:CRISPR-associated endonuclease/helicase Cas3